MSETNEEFVVVQDAKTDDHDFHHDEVEDFDDSNVIQDEILQEWDYVETETVHEDGLTKEEDDPYANESNPQLTNDAESEVKTRMEDVEDEVFDDTKNDDALIKVTSFDSTIAVLIGHVLILTSFGVICCLKGKKSSDPVTKPLGKEGFMDLEPSTNPESMIQQKEVVPSLQIDTSKLHIPSSAITHSLVRCKQSVLDKNCTRTTININIFNSTENQRPVTWPAWPVLMWQWTGVWVVRRGKRVVGAAIWPEWSGYKALRPATWQGFLLWCLL
ncbi:hypothetical protein R6Q57_020680 [Mikania cordata]